MDCLFMYLMIIRIYSKQTFVNYIRFKFCSFEDPNGRCDLFEFSLDSLIHLQSLVIGNECFSSVKQFIIKDKEFLKSIQIGENSFTSQKKGKGNDPSKSFSITSCPSLQSIEIGCFSFSDYAGKFELNQLPSLETIKIGEIGMPSMNFSYSSFIVQSHIHSIQ